MADDLHLIQYRDRVEGGRRRQVTTVLCREHRLPLLARLRAQIIGCSGTPAPILSKCDECVNS